MQKTTRLQRLLAVVVAVFMAVCCLPLSAFADGENIQACTYYVTQVDKDGNVIGAEDEKVEFDINANGDLPVLMEVPALQGYFSHDGYKLAEGKSVCVNNSYDVNPAELCVVYGMDQHLKIYFNAVETGDPDYATDYTIQYVDENGTKIADPMDLHITWKGETGPNLMDYLRDNGAIKSIDGYTYAYVCAAGGSEDSKYAEDSQAVVVTGGPYTLEVHYTTNAVEPEQKPSTYTFNFYQVGDTSKTIRDSVTVTIKDFDNLVDKYVMDRFAAARAELEATGEWKYDHYENAYNPGEAGQTDAVVVPNVNMVYNVYFKPVSVEPEQKSTYTFNFYELGNKDNVLYTAYTVEVTDFSENAADKYVMDLFAKGRKAVEDTGKWTYVSYESDYNPGVEGQVSAVVVPNVNMVYNVYFAPVSAEKKSTYTFNFYETDNKDKVLHEPVTVTVTDFDNLVDKYVMDLFATARKEVEDSGNWSYNFYESEYGIEGQVDSLVVPGVNLSYNVYFNCKDRSSKYTIHFVDENNNEFQDPTVVNMAWVEGQELNLMAQLKDTLATVNAKGYTFKTLTAWNGTEAYKGDELVVPGEYELIAHCVKNTSDSTGGDNNSNNNNSNNNNTKTVSSNNNQVVKADAPADNTAKIMPQTGLSVETPVVFGVMMVAALAGAGAYLFAIRKKLN